MRGARGSTIRSVRQCRQLGTEGVLDLIPAGVRYYVTIDIDGFDPSIAPGTGTPSHGGFLYWEVMEILQGLAKRGKVVGIDLVEVAPAYDPSGITAIPRGAGAAELPRLHLPRARQASAAAGANVAGLLQVPARAGSKLTTREGNDDGHFCKELPLALLARLRWPCFGRARSLRDARAAVGEADKITCMYPVWVGFGPVHLANELGYFKDEGHHRRGDPRRRHAERHRRHGARRHRLLPAHRRRVSGPRPPQGHAGHHHRHDRPFDRRRRLGGRPVDQVGLRPEGQDHRGRAEPAGAAHHADGAEEAVQPVDQGHQPLGPRGRRRDRRLRRYQRRGGRHLRAGAQPGRLHPHRTAARTSSPRRRTTTTSSSTSSWRIPTS